MSSETIFKDRTDADAKTSPATLQKWGGLASFLLAAAFIVPAFIYLTGNLQEASGPLVYALADFLAGPVWAASLITAVLALRERLGGHAPRRMSLALGVALVAAAAMVAVACIRSANRHYHLLHPDLHLEDSTTVLAVWATLVAGVAATGWHLLGWAWVLLGWAGWTSRLLPRPLTVLYWAAGAVSLFVYVLPDFEEVAMTLGLAVSLWQGLLLWKALPGEEAADR